MLTADQIEAYRTNGYIGVENVLSSSQLEEARRVVDEFVERSREVSESDDIFDLEPEHTRERPLLRRLKNAGQVAPIFRRFDALRRDPGSRKPIDWPKYPFPRGQTEHEGG